MGFKRHLSKLKVLSLKTMLSKAVTTTIVISWMMMSLYYYNIFNIIGEYSFTNTKENITTIRRLPFRNISLLVDTPGCVIPNYIKTLHFKEAIPRNPSCGTRAVHVNKIGHDNIEFIIHKKNIEIYSKKLPYECFYRFVSRSTVVGSEDTKLYYTPRKRFRNGTRIPLEQEVITVNCNVFKKNKTVYDDAYIVLKRIKRPRRNKSRWNVLLIGMDTMSRGRVYNSMPATVKYLEQNDWLDYRGYQKVAFNTFPNMMSVLTGKKVSTVYHACSDGMSSCNNLMMWARYQEAGYTTAYGEDYIRLPDTFHPYKGFKTPPTHHYMRPLFLTKEVQNKGTICTEKLPSGKHMLNYAKDFANTYKSENFFGLFWMNSYSHNLDNVPTSIDKPMVEFFKHLNNSGVLLNTFVIFFSDHGIRFGEMRYPVESYYEERLPMLFIWTPEKFRKSNPTQYEAATTNQHRLITPYDLHMTLQEILEISVPTSSTIQNSEACPDCTSLFEEKPLTRTCKDAKVDEKWCSCHSLQRVVHDDVDAIECLDFAVTYIQNLSQSVQTTDCMRCHNMTLKTVLRLHSYVNEDFIGRVYYVVAFVMEPGDVAYEANVYKENDSLKIVQPTETISAYNIRGNCVKHPPDRAFCVCDERPCNK